MSLKGFREKYEGEKIGFPPGSYVGQCLSLVKQYLREEYKIYPPPSGVGSAWGYWINFPTPLPSVLKKVPYKKGLVPKRGWIPVWNKNTGGGHGHIAIVLEASSDHFYSFDQNWFGKQAHRQKHNYSNIYGYLVPKGESMPDTGKITIDQSTFEELVTKSSKYDSFNSAGYENVEQVNNKLDELRQESKSANDARKQAAEMAEVSRRELTDFIAALADDQHLKTRQDKSEILSVASRYGTLLGNYEDLSIKYQKGTVGKQEIRT